MGAGRDQDGSGEKAIPRQSLLEGGKSIKNPAGGRDGLKKDKSEGIRVERSSGDHGIQPGFGSGMSENQHG